MEKNKVMVFEYPEELDNSLKEIGLREERSRAFLIRKAIKEFIQRKNEVQQK